MTLTQAYPTKFAGIINLARKQSARHDHSGLYTLDEIVEFEDEIGLVFSYVVSFRRISLADEFTAFDITEVTLLD